MRQRVFLAAAALALACCMASGPPLDETQIRARASSDLSCEEQLIRIELESTTRYVVRGCGQVRTYDCAQDGTHVVCTNPMAESASSDSSESSVSTGGCGCGHLFSGRTKSPEPTPAEPSVMSHTPQTKKNER